jgi:hypothetical protein
MPDPNTLGVILIAVAAGALILRLLAARSSRLRPWAMIGTLAILGVLVLVIGLVAWSVVRAYVGALPG